MSRKSLDYERRPTGGKWRPITFHRLKIDIWQYFGMDSPFPAPLINAVWQLGQTIVVGGYEYRKRP